MTTSTFPKNPVDPPPYSLVAAPSRPKAEGITEVVMPTATVTQIHLGSKSEDIEGTFRIDPSAPVIGDIPKIRYGKRKGRNSKKVGSPHASFQTRSGNMKLQLASMPGAKGERAEVLVGSKSGKLEITLAFHGHHGYERRHVDEYDIQLPRVARAPGGTTPERGCMGLEVFSRSGDVIVFVPATYSGVMRVESVKGAIRFLPSFASHMRVLKATDREKMVTIGENAMDELCEVTTRSGTVVVGLAGRDEYQRAGGLWKRLFG